MASYPAAVTYGGTSLNTTEPTAVTAAGYDAKPHGINSEGLKRRGFDAQQIMQIKRAYKALFRNGLSLEEAKLELATMAKSHAEISLLADFLNVSTRGIIR